MTDIIHTLAAPAFKILLLPPPTVHPCAFSLSSQFAEVGSCIKYSNNELAHAHNGAVFFFRVNFFRVIDLKGYVGHYGAVKITKPHSTYRLNLELP
jgi:hypothetical protein